MSDHKIAIAPLEAWCYASPEIRASGKSIDIGLFAEALIYYDCVAVNLTNQPKFVEFLTWFLRQGRLDDFLALVRDGVIKIYDYAFLTVAVDIEGVYSITNMQNPIQAEPDTFEQRFLYHPSIKDILTNARHRRKLYQALRGNVIGVKANDFGGPIENARKDFENSQRNALMIQAFVDELYHFKKLGKPPVVQATVARSPEGKKHTITWNVDFAELAALAGPELNFHFGTPLTAGAHSNRLLWSAAQLTCDLYLPKPMSTLVGDKLYESTEKIAKAGKVIEELKAEVEFPDVRELVNSGRLSLSEILTIREKARSFRDWLQQESDRDRNAIIAYHKEVAKETGFSRGARKSLGLFGLIGGGAVGSLIGSAIAGPAGGALGAAAGGAMGYLADVASKLGSNWKPVVFGEWLRDRIEREVLTHDDINE